MGPVPAPERDRAAHDAEHRDAPRSRGQETAGPIHDAAAEHLRLMPRPASPPVPVDADTASAMVRRVLRQPVDAGPLAGAAARIERRGDPRTTDPGDLVAQPVRGSRISRASGPGALDVVRKPSPPGDAVVRRMTVGGMGRNEAAKEYGPGTTPTFKADVARVRKLGKGERAFMKVVHEVDPAMTSDDFALLYSRFAASATAFTDLDHFLREMRILRQNWGAQKFFHEKPGAQPYSDVSSQNKEQPIRLYGSKRREDVKNLYLWASANGVAMSGHAKLLGKPLPTGEPGYLPKGHWADRAHTISYGAQQGEERDLVCIELTPKATNELRTAKGKPEKVATEGGEGYLQGEFGLKSESTFVSVAIGESALTWDFMKSRIALIDFSPPK